jgi:hypothetical protein
MEGLMDRFDDVHPVGGGRSGSLSAAARRLNTPLTTVSRKVAELETHPRPGCSTARAGGSR